MIDINQANNHSSAEALLVKFRSELAWHVGIAYKILFDQYHNKLFITASYPITKRNSQ